MKRINLVRKSAVWLLIGIASAACGSQAQAQCADGSCGNVSYADGYGGYASGGFGGAAVTPSGSYWGYRHPQPLFDNHFTQGYANNADAALYISPVGVPGNVGHTYITNQAFYPHEFLYAHHDKYHSYYDNGMGLNRTSAHYYSPPLRSGVSYLGRQLSLPRQ